MSRAARKMLRSVMVRNSTGAGPLSAPAVRRRRLSLRTRNRQASDAKIVHYCASELGAADGPMEPGAGIGPESVGRARRHPQRFGGRINRQPGEVPEFDQLGRLRVNGRQTGQRLVHGEDLVVPIGGGDSVLAEFGPDPSTADLEALL